MVDILMIALYLFQADFPICTEPDDQRYATPVFVNGQYYVFWSDSREVSIDSTSGVYGTRIDTTGNVLDPEGKRLFLDSCWSKPMVAYDGTNFLIVFKDGC